MPTMAAALAVPALPWVLVIMVWSTLCTPPGASCSTLASSLFVVDLPSRPRAETSTRMPGAMAITAR